MKNNKQLLANALIEICNIKPLDKITVTEITKKAGLTRQVFYHHFLDKYELAKWVHMQDFIQHVKATTLENNGEMYLEEIMLEWLLTLEKHKVFYRNTYHSLEAKEFQMMICNHVYESYKQIVLSTTQKPLSEETNFILQIYCIGACQKCFDWIIAGCEIHPKVICKWMFNALPQDLQKSIVNYKISKKEVIQMTKYVAYQSEVDKKSYMA